MPTRVITHQSIARRQRRPIEDPDPLQRGCIAQQPVSPYNSGPRAFLRPGDGAALQIQILHFRIETHVASLSNCLLAN